MVDIPDEWVEKAARAICAVDERDCDMMHVCDRGPPCKCAWWKNHAPSARAALTAVLPLILERAAGEAEKTFPRGSAHTYASENADLYLAQEDAADRIAAAIRALGEPRNDA